MSSICPPASRIESVVRQVCCALEQREALNSPWTAASEDNLWRELVACVLGSRVRFESAQAAIERMDKANLFSELRRFSGPQQYEQDIINVLSEGKQTYKSIHSQGRYPFARLRASQISRAAQRLYSDNGSIYGLLCDAQDAQVARRRLTAEVPGLGPKQASLFLRNVGYADGVAVLDVHVLTYMNWIGLIPVPIRSVPTIRRYEILERMFIEHSCTNGFQPDHFDIAVWVVIRTAKKECRIWR